MGDIPEFIVSTEYDGKRRRLYPKNCKGCGNVFFSPKHADRKYCKIDCSKISHQEVSVSVTCDFCGKVTIKNPSSMKKSKSGYRFCDRACKDEGQRLGSNLQKMRPKHYSDGRHSYREIAKRGSILECNRCKWKEVPGVLKVHHRDRNRDNNTIENLEILCPNCHDIEHFSRCDGNYNWKKMPVADNGLVAHLGERFTCNEEAVSSILTESTNI